MSLRSCADTPFHRALPPLRPRAAAWGFFFFMPPTITYEPASKATRDCVRSAWYRMFGYDLNRLRATEQGVERGNREPRGPAGPDRGLLRRTWLVTSVHSGRRRGQRGEP